MKSCDKATFISEKTVAGDGPLQPPDGSVVTTLCEYYMLRIKALRRLVAAIQMMMLKQAPMHAIILLTHPSLAPDACCIVSS